MKKIFIKFLLIFLISFLLTPFLPVPAKAAGATLFLSPGSGTYIVGKSFTVKVMVNSGGGVGINAAEGVIKYDPSFLLVANVSKTSSIFNLWTTEPTFSNTQGTITFGGGSPSAYTDTAGGIFTVTFSAKKAGAAEVSFSSGMVLAADGKGTNIFSGFGNANYSLMEAEKKEEKPKKKEEKKETAKGILPPLPEVSSPTHPNEDEWYNNNDPEFTWKILPDLTGVSFMITESPDSSPGSVSDGVVENKKFKDIEDGERYFHIKYQNKYGWGKIAHRKFLVDATPPEAFNIKVDNNNDLTEPSPKLEFSTTDETSGIDYYNIIINEEIIKIAPSDMDKGYYKVGPLWPGQYIIFVAALDKAKNTASSTVKFTIEPLKPPVITSIPKIINKKDDLIIRGTSFYTRTTIKIYISKEGSANPEEYSVRTDDAGNWTYFYKGDLEKGGYKVWAKLIDERGAQSLDSTSHILTVVSPSIIASYGWLIIIILLIIIGVLIAIIIYQRKEFIEEKLRIKRETEEVKDKLSKIFFALREEVDELIAMADKKKGLSESERKVKEKLQESLDISEEFISKEVEDIEKEINLGKKKEGKR